MAQPIRPSAGSDPSAAGPTTGADPGRLAQRRDPDWFRSATRWTQLTFAEDDPAHFDLDFWVETMRRTRSNALCLSAGGYIAYYPTKIDYHYRSAFLGDSDPFGELVEQARRLGMHVMARVDPHAIHGDAAEAHPEWLARDRDGQPIDHPGTPRLFEPGTWNPVAKGAGPFYFPDGKARFNVAKYEPPTEDTDSEYPIILTTGRTVNMFLSGNQTRRIGPLVDQYAEPLLELHPTLARQYGIADGD